MCGGLASELRQTGLSGRQNPFIPMPMNTTTQVEDWILTEVEKPEPDVSGILGRLSEMARGGGTQEAQAIAQLAETALADKGQVNDALRVLRLRADWVPAAEFRNECATVVQKILGKGQEKRAFVKNCGFDKRISISECLDRLDCLRALETGTLCFDKTWGFGVVQAVEPFYERVTIDFERKPEHELSLAYAAETLEIINDQHILAIRHQRPEELAEWVKSDPAAVVRLALTSYGPLNAVILQEKLSPAVVPPEDWKTFWAAARKALKKDPDAVVPTKRTEPILIKEAAGAMDEAWFRQLKTDRDVESILTKISDWHTLQSGETKDPLQLSVIEDRLQFVIRGADLMGKTVMPRAMMLAHEVFRGEDHLGVSAYVDRILEENQLGALLEILSARDMKAFVAFLMDVDRERTLAALLRLLHTLDVSSLSEVLQLLIKEGAEEDVRHGLSQLMQRRSAGVEILSWLSRNMEKLSEWSLCSPMEFAEVTLLEMEKDHTGNRLKAQNQLRDRFTQKTWVRNLFDQLGSEGRDRYFVRLKDSSAWPTMEKRSVLGHIIKLYPELEKWMTAKQADKNEPTAPRGPVTSIRSYRERQLQVEKIKKVDIPNNSKEIAVARAHGDLRENFEYQAAKDAQGLLMRRQAELEQMLAKVVPTEFAGIPADQVAIGTGVRLEYEDGRQEQYYILGVWDRDEELGIISSESRLAQSLDGHRAGDQVPVPTEHGESSCRIVEVMELSDEIRAWIKDVPGSLGNWTPGE